MARSIIYATNYSNIMRLGTTKYKAKKNRSYNKLVEVVTKAVVL